MKYYAPHGDVRKKGTRLVESSYYSVVVFDKREIRVFGLGTSRKGVYCQLPRSGVEKRGVFFAPFRRGRDWAHGAKKLKLNENEKKKKKRARTTNKKINLAAGGYVFVISV